MDKKQYEWLLAVALAWRTFPVGDDDPSPLIGQIDGISGRLVRVAWLAANEAGFGAVCLAIWHSGSAKFVAMFVVAVNFSAKVAFAQDSAEILHFSYGPPTSAHSIPVNPVSANSHALSHQSR